MMTEGRLHLLHGLWTNSINSVPAEFTLISPEQDEETGLTPTFSWNRSSDADLYDEIAYTLSYSSNPSSLNNVSISSNSSSNSGNINLDNKSLSLSQEIMEEYQYQSH